MMKIICVLFLSVFCSIAVAQTKPAAKKPAAKQTAPSKKPVANTPIKKTAPAKPHADTAKHHVTPSHVEAPKTVPQKKPGGIGDTVISKTGLKYILVKPGTGNKPKLGDKVKVYYSGKLMNGKVFDHNQEDSPLKFELGDHNVLPGWNEAIQLMKEEEHAKFIIPAYLAYGTKGYKDPHNPKKYLVPPNSDLIFEIELISFK